MQPEPRARTESVDASARCCAVDPRIARRFDEISREWADTDELPDMVGVSARLLDLLRDAPTRRPSVLELGSGWGALSVALLEMGARQVTGVDLSTESVEIARRRAVAGGFAESASFQTGNAADAEVEPHDWVVLDRVICCFADVDRMLTRALALARERVALTVPDSRGWRGLLNRPMWAAENVWDLLHGGCRGYVHDVRRIQRQLAGAGFRATATGHQGLWFLGVYDRT